MTPVKIWSTKTVSAALPKTYHQLADFAGTWCSATSRIVPPIFSRSSNQRQIFSSIRLLSARGRSAGLQACFTADLKVCTTPGVSPIVQLRGRRQRRQLAGIDEQVAVLDLVWVLKEPARRRAGRPRSVFVVHAAVTGTHEEPRLREPAHGTAKVRAVDREHLELVALKAPDPAGKVIGVAGGDA